MSRPQKSRARWDAQRQELILPLPERLVVRAAAQLGHPSLPGIEALGAWLRRFVRMAAMKPRGRPRGNLRTPSGALLTMAEHTLSKELQKQKKQKSSFPVKIR